ncbi:uncharacterized protein LOC111131589 isoform X2 [Crassostrea virginica]
MSENRKYENVLEVIPDKNVTSFTKWYNSMRRPLREFHLKNIVRKSVEVGFTEGVRILVNENGVSCLSLGRASSVFHLACEYGQVEIVKFLLTLDICDTFFQRVNFINMDGLAIAAEKRNENLFNVLLASGKFEMENMPFEKVPRLFNALERGEKDLAIFFIQRGANVKSVGVSTKLGPISSVCISAMKIPSITVELLKRGGNATDVHEKTGKSVLQLAIESNADRCTVKDILSYGANIGLKDKHGNTALSSLKAIGQLYGILDAGVSVTEMENTFKFSTLGFVVEHSHAGEDVQFFLEKGANVNFYDKIKGSLLIRAVKSQYSSEKDVLVLLQHGADPHQKNCDGYTALQFFCKCKMGSPWKTALHLLEYGAKPIGCLNDVVNKAFTTDECRPLVEKLLQCGADPNEECGSYESILSTAIRRKLDITEELINHGASTNIKSCDVMSPLSYACSLGTHDQEFKNLKALLKCPTNLNYSEFQAHVDAVVRNATETFQQSGNQRILTFDLRGVFFLLAAGLDFTPKESRRQSHQFDDFDDYNRFDDYDYDYEYQEDDYYNSDRQEMIFDTSADEWVPIWW